MITADDSVELASLLLLAVEIEVENEELVIVGDPVWTAMTLEEKLKCLPENIRARYVEIVETQEQVARDTQVSIKKFYNEHGLK